MKKKILFAAAVVALCGIFAACKTDRKELRPVQSIIEEAFGEEQASQAVRDVVSSLEVDDRFEQILVGHGADIDVWCLMRLNDEQSADGMGVLIKKGDKLTALPDIHHGGNACAKYDAEAGLLRLSCREMAGTGINVERLYLLRFDEDGTAHIQTTIDPYDMQQAFRQRLFFSIDGQDISFYEKERLLCAVTDTVTDMGGFDEDPIWIGEQLCYDISDDDIRVLCTPGLKYVTGLALNYDAMPTLEATMTFNAAGRFSLGEIGIDHGLKILE